MSNSVFYVTNPRVKDLYCIPNIIEASGDDVRIYSSKKELADGFSNKIPDLIICDRSTFLLTKDQINLINSNCYNIHPSLLPYNRGYHPNFWSFYDNTPCGVTIHCIDNNIDTGKIIAQTEVHFDDKETLKSSYELLRNCSISLFKIVYPLLRKGIDKDKLKINDINIGKTNFKSDFDNVFEILPKGWDTEISFVRSLSKQKKLIRRND